MTSVFQKSFRTVRSCVFGLVLFVIAAARAADGTPVWTNYYGLPGNSMDQAMSVAVDTNGNVIVIGSGRTTIKYSSAGVPLWTNFCADQPNAVVVDGSGDVIVAGGFSDYVTIKYSSAGVPLWTNLFDGPAGGQDMGRALALDGSGNVFVTGWTTASANVSKVATIKYSGAGVPLWTNFSGGLGVFTEIGNAIVVDHNGDVIVAGSLAMTGGTIKYSGAGVPLWTNLCSGTTSNSYNAVANAVAVDASNNVVIMGISKPADNQTQNYMTVKYSSTGVPLWTNIFNGTGAHDDFPTGLAVDSAGNAIVTGRTVAKLVEFSNPSFDYGTIKYSSAGVPLWTNKFNGAADGDDRACGVVVDGSDNVIVMGSSAKGPSVFALAAIVTIKYSSAGVPIWLNACDGKGQASLPNALAVDRAGGVSVTGSTLNGGASYDYITIKYSGAVPPPVLLPPVMSGTNILLTWSAVSNTTYRLEYNPDLDPAHWTPVPGDVTSQGNAASKLDSSRLGRRFYRVHVLP